MMSTSEPGTPKRHRRKFSMGSYNIHKEKEKEKKRLSKKELSESNLVPRISRALSEYAGTVSERQVSIAETAAELGSVPSRRTNSACGENGLTSTGAEDSDNDSAESDQTENSEDSKIATQKQTSSKSEPKRTRGWVILEGLRGGQTCDQKPEKYDGFMMKRRKWPMKGWHKRFFVLENGILTYAKSQNDLLKGKYHGTVDIGLVVLTYKKTRRMIDIDADDLIYHLKVSGKNVQAQFDRWIEQFRHHRLYRQHEIAFGTRDAPRLTDVPTPVEEFSTPITSPVQNSPVALSERALGRGSFKTRASTKVTAWLLDSSGMESTYKELVEAQANIYELGNLLRQLQSFHVQNGVTNGVLDTLEVPNGEKALHQSSSNPNLVGGEGAKLRPVSLPDTLSYSQSSVDPRLQELTAREDFLNKSKSIHEQLKHLSRTIMTERERLKQALGSNNSPMPANMSSYISALKTSLAETTRQNEEYRTRLARIHADSNVASLVASPTAPGEKLNGTALPVERKQSVTDHMLANSASWESQSAPSVSEFYDAEEYHLSSEDSSEEEEEEEEGDDAGSDVSDIETTVVPNSDEEQFTLKRSMTGRRCKLAAPKPDDTNVSLFGLLRKNIGKDLSKISMPVSLNEPLSMLQRLCEELEYSELLDKAADTEDPVQRMCLIAAFTVSPYASTFYRAGQKPFNPLLGETYECIREDKGWRFIAEQVSHHPPVSACYCESKNFVFWQDIRVKTKFWGKSMELQPQGNVQLKLPKYKDHYSWNKATTCVHNLLGGQRWVDHYGEVNIVNKSNTITCKLTYTKCSYWSSNRHEVYGTVFEDGREAVTLFGKWNEGFYFGKHPSSAKCIWRPGSMPEDYDLYYGFTRFAIELNEIERDQVHLYAPTDTRFRKDQRYLEEGRLEEAEAEKHRVEHLQRERRKLREAEKSTYTPRWFMKTEESGKDVYMYTGKYYDFRKDPGFSRLKIPELW